MNIDKYQKKIERMDQLIRLRATGSPTEFAKKLNVSKSTLYEYFKDLKDIGAEVVFNRDSNNFQYKEPGKLSPMHFEKYCIDQDINKITGGKENLNYFSQSDFFGLQEHTFALLK